LKPCIGHSIEYLSLTVNWAYNQIVGLKEFESAVVLISNANKESFPLKRAYYANDSKIFMRMIQKVFGRLGLIDYQAYKFLKNNNVVLLHSHFGPQGYKNLSLVYKLKLPHITTFYGYDVGMLPNLYPNWRDRYKRLFDECNLFLAEGNRLKKSLMSLGCPEEKIIVQHLGVDLNRIPYMPRKIDEDGSINILASATFIEKKGLPYALEAFASVRKKYPNIVFTLIGGVPNRKDKRYLREEMKIFEVIKKYKLEDSVNMLGYLPYDDYIKEALKAHIFIHPSITASDGDTEGGAPVSIIEMSASGMPILSTFHCDISEVVIDGVTGYLVPERGVEALTDKLDYLVSHPGVWQDFGYLGRQHISNEFNLKHQIDKLESIYTDIIQAK